jgi:hypothetical protein
MGKRLKIVLGSAAAVAIMAASSIGVARAAFDRRLAGEVDKLFASRVGAESNLITEADLASLPEPVQRWLRYSGVVGKVIPTAIRLKQEGELRLGEKGWLPFTAVEYYTTDPPGFVWSTQIQMSPLVPVVGRDAYFDGRGSMDMRLLGLITVAKDSGPDMDQGDLLRYLNEIMWFPAGAISPHITWEGIDASSARATMSYGGVSAPATFFFDADGRLTTMVAERFDRDDGKVNRWSTPVTAYGEFFGIRIPVAGEALYVRASGDYPYIRARITAVEYDRPERYLGDEGGGRWTRQRRVGWHAPLQRGCRRSRARVLRRPRWSGSTWTAPGPAPSKPA